MKPETTRWMLIILAIITVCVLLYVFYGPEQQRRVPVSRFQGCPINIAAPSHPRPGMKGVRLTRGEDLVFQIDYNYSNQMRHLNWNSFIDYANAHVEIIATIDTTGMLRDIVRHDIGYGAAADTVLAALRTWRFTPYMSGTVTFVFNASSGMVVDTRELHVNSRFSNCDIVNGRLLRVRNASGVNVDYY